uniref:Eukaryotic translation initiation factor 4E n=1 Tax=viral metagenome TaxID=1070528 RepID=A0A6C0JAA4_9ZZZZ
MEEPENIIFDHTWTMWFHKVEDSDYSIGSYKKLFTVSSVKDLCMLINTVPNITSGMFFFMKDGIEPLWENDANINGGMWTFKLTKSDSNEMWKILMAALCGNVLTLNPENMKHINGISVSPKITNCIIKIWTNNSTNQTCDGFLTPFDKLDYVNSYYRKNKKGNKK